MEVVDKEEEEERTGDVLLLDVVAFALGDDGLSAFLDDVAVGDADADADDLVAFVFSDVGIGLEVDPDEEVTLPGVLFVLVLALSLALALVAEALDRALAPELIIFLGGGEASLFLLRLCNSRRLCRISSSLDLELALVADDLMLETEESSSSPPPPLEEVVRPNLLVLGEDDTMGRPLDSLFRRSSSNFDSLRLCTLEARTNTPPSGGQLSKYFFPLTVPSFLPFPSDTPVRRTPTQSSPSANSTGPTYATRPTRGWLGGFWSTFTGSFTFKSDIVTLICDDDIMVII